MRILAVHSASARLSIVLAEGHLTEGVTRILAQSDIAEPRDQGNILLHSVIGALKNNNLSFGDLDLMAAVTGPGSFTGIRIGLAALRGFALAGDVKLVGINSFDLYAGAAIPTPHRLTVIESWRDELYFRLDQQQPFNITPQDCVAMLADQKIHAADITVVGDAALKMAQHLNLAKIVDNLPTPHDLAHVVLTQPETHGAPTPFYLRPADVSFGRGNRTLEQEKPES